MVPAVRSTLDVALWMLTRAESAGERLQPQKLQRMLYLAQAHYAGGVAGGKLMPATFLATELGPIEPNVYHLFENGPPRVPMADPRAEVEDFLMGLWDRYGRRDSQDLLESIAADGAFALAFKRGRNTEITVELMAAGYGGERAPAGGIRGGAKPDAEPGVWTQTGKRATKWIPGQKAAAKKVTTSS